MAQPAGPRARARFVRETPDVRRQALIEIEELCSAALRPPSPLI